MFRGAKYLAGAASAAFVFGDWNVDASHAENAPAASFPWNHAGMTEGYDHRSYVFPFLLLPPSPSPAQSSSNLFFYIL